MNRNNGANLFLNVMNKVGNDTNVMMIGEVESYDSSTNMAKVTPLHTVPDQGVEYPPLICVPVGYFSIGGFSMRVQPVKGDKLIILFCDYDIENLLVNGTKQNKTTRTHALDDAIVLPLSINFLNNVDNVTQDFTISKDGTNTSIVLKNNGDIALNSDGNIYLGGESATHPVALADEIQQIFNNHTHSAPNGGGNTSGPSNSFTAGSSTIFSK